MSLLVATKHSVALALTAVVFSTSAAFALDQAPEGCYLQLDREGTYVCCPTKRGAILCTLQESTLRPKTRG
jgi:hypothetical protein